MTDASSTTALGGRSRRTTSLGDRLKKVSWAGPVWLAAAWPLGCSSERNLERRRWDRQVMAVPFDRVRITVGEPIWLDGEAARRTGVDAVQAALDRIDPR